MKILLPLIILLTVFASNAHAVIDWRIQTLAEAMAEIKYHPPSAPSGMNAILPRGVAVGGGAVAKRGVGTIVRSAGVTAGRFVAPIAIALTLAELYNILKNDPQAASQYPDLYNAMYKNGEFPNLTDGMMVPDTTIGAIVKRDGNYYRLVSYDPNGTGGCSAWDCQNQNKWFAHNNTYVVYGFEYSTKVYYYTPIGTPAPVPANEQEFSSNLSAPDNPTTPDVNESTTDIKPEVNNDIDKYINNNYQNDNRITYNNTFNEFASTFNDFTKQNYTNTVNNNVASATDNKDKADQAVTDAQARYDANPTDENFQTLQEAKNAQQQAEQGLSEAQVQQASSDSNDGPPPVPPAKDARKSFDWAKWNLLKNIMTTVFPFSLISSLSNYVSLLVADPVAPSFTLPLYGNQITVSLSIFDTLAMICRWIMSLLMVVGSIQLVIYFYRGGGQ